MTCYCALRPWPHRHVLRMLDMYALSRNSRLSLAIVLQHCDTSLWRIFRDSGSTNGLALARVAQHVEEAMSGVSHLHSLGIVHGDLSLSNLLVSSTGVKVADMNTAHWAHDFIVPESWKW